jgi:DNA-binding NtrC family response regulator
MRLSVCTDVGDHASVEFWSSTPGVRAVDIVHRVSDLSAVIGTPGAPDVIIARLPNTEMGNAEILAAIQRISQGGTPLIAWVPEASAAGAFNLCYLGADELITDQSSHEDRASALAMAKLRRRGSKKWGETEAAEGAEPWSRSLVGGSCSMRVVKELVRLVSPRRATVLITGETGTGKEVVARALHDASPRAAQPMVCINCNAIPGELLEAELFGHVRGAYTGAFQSRLGRFEQANRGTLFLDEIGDMPFSLQAKLLRVLQEREFHRLGSSETMRVDVRVIAATNANLAKLVEEGKFRQDLYYRLNVAPIHLPTLRERVEDIPDLVSHFIEKICRNEQIPMKAIPNEIIAWLTKFPWPGNIRQLENTIESAIALSGIRTTLRMADFSALSGSPNQPRMFAMPTEGIDYNLIVGQFEKTLLSEALRLAGGSKKRAASLLQLKRTTFYAKLDALHVELGEELTGVEVDEEAAFSAA